MAGVVVAVGENCDFMCGSEVRHRAECVRPICLDALWSDDAQTFLLVVGDVSHCRSDQLHVCWKRALLDLETHGVGTERLTQFSGLGANYHEQNVRCLGQ